jgi:uncharacterized protein (DUF2062 family)
MWRKSLRRLLAIDDPPERTALAFAIGVFIAFSPFLGLHTIIATVLAVIFRFNKVAIYTGTFVNNPFLTLVPIIVASFAIGAFVLGRPVAVSAEGMRLLTEPHLLTGGYWRRLSSYGWEIVLPYAIGGMMLSFICSLASYPLTLGLLRRRRTKREEAGLQETKA